MFEAAETKPAASAGRGKVGRNLADPDRCCDRNIHQVGIWATWGAPQTSHVTGLRFRTGHSSDEIALVEDDSNEIQQGIGSSCRPYVQSRLARLRCRGGGSVEAARIGWDEEGIGIDLRCRQCHQNGACGRLNDRRTSAKAG